jgi:hypothetical protein
VLKLATAYIEKEVSKVSTQDDRPIGEIIGGKLYPAKQLADQEGANIKDARVAMEDAGQDVEKARALLRERDQVDTPEKRRAKRRAWREWKIKDLEESKPGWRQFYLDKVAEAEEELARLKEEERRDV